MIRGVTAVGSRARFWAGLGAARRNQLAALPGWETRLDVALDEPASVWRSEWVARDEFAAELSARLNEDDEGSITRWWDHLRPVDLYLACACARGVDGALERFERLYGDEIARTAQRFERPGLPADDLVQHLRAKLFTLPGGDGVQHRAPDGRPRIAMYTGQGFLQNWLRVTTTRTFIDCCRGQPESPREVGVRAFGVRGPGARHLGTAGGHVVDVDERRAAADPQHQGDDGDDDDESADREGDDHTHMGVEPGTEVGEAAAPRPW